MKPKVSVILPIFNVSRYLDKALECAKRQTLKEIEIICINDGSTDDSLDIIKKWAEGDDRFVIVDKKNEGYGVGLNVGMEKATGEYVAILEPDDFVPLNMYEDLYDIAKANDLDIVKGDFYKFTESDKGNMAFRYIALDKNGKCYGRVIDPAEEPQITQLISYTWTGMYRREFLERFSIKHNTTPRASFQDIGFFWLTTTHAKRVMLINKPYYRYRTDNPNQSVRNRDKVYTRDNEFDYIKERLVNDPDPDIWKRFKPYYYMSRFRRGLVNFKRIHEDFADEYSGFMRELYSESVENGDFDPKMLADDDREAFDMMMNAPDEFKSKYHVIKGQAERERNSDIWEVLKAEKKENKELRKENKKLKEALNKIENSKSYRFARKIGKMK